MFFDAGIIVIGFAFFALFPVAAFVVIWYGDEIVQFVIDTIQRRNFVAEHERDRKFDGRLFSRADEVGDGIHQKREGDES